MSANEETPEIAAARREAEFDRDQWISRSAIADDSRQDEIDAHNIAIRSRNKLDRLTGYARPSCEALK